MDRRKRKQPLDQRRPPSVAGERQQPPGFGHEEGCKLLLLLSQHCFSSSHCLKSAGRRGGRGLEALDVLKDNPEVHQNAVDIVPVKVA